MPSPRISIQAIIVIGLKKKKKRWSECFDFFLPLWCATVWHIRVDSIKTSASDQGPQLRPSLCPSPGGS